MFLKIVHNAEGGITRLSAYERGPQELPGELCIVIPMDESPVPTGRLQAEYRVEDEQLVEKLSIPLSVSVLSVQAPGEVVITGDVAQPTALAIKGPEGISELVLNPGEPAILAVPVPGEYHVQCAPTDSYYVSPGYTIEALPAELE